MGYNRRPSSPSPFSCGWTTENVPPGLWFDEAQNGIVGRQLVEPNGVHFTFITDLTQMGRSTLRRRLLVKLMGNVVVPLRLIRQSAAR